MVRLSCFCRDQLEKSEALRQETQSTVEALRQEFEHLAQELVKYKTKDGQAGTSPDLPQAITTSN